MADRRRRELERLAHADPEAEGAWLAERVRVGDLDPHTLRLVASLGHTGCQRLCGVADDDLHPQSRLRRAIRRGILVAPGELATISDARVLATFALQCAARVCSLGRGEAAQFAEVLRLVPLAASGDASAASALELAREQLQALAPAREDQPGWGSARMALEYAYFATVPGTAGGERQRQLHLRRDAMDAALRAARAVAEARGRARHELLQRARQAFVATDAEASDEHRRALEEESWWQVERLVELLLGA